VRNEQRARKVHPLAPATGATVSLEGMEWVPQALVIGPQGVLDVVNMTGKLIKEFAGLKQVGAQVHLQWVIYFPWVPDEGKFKGELIYSIRQL
jgi:hypothetical protein